MPAKGSERNYLHVPLEATLADSHVCYISGEVNCNAVEMDQPRCVFESHASILPRA
jgi:hypothetical protein